MMRRPAISRLAAVLIAAGALAPAVGMASAQADTVPMLSPSSNICSPATICAWSGTYGTGGEASFPTSMFHSKWYDFDNPIGFHPGSIADSSNSVIWVYDKQAGPYVGNPFCATPNAGNTVWNLYGEYGWFYIQYNVHTCSGNGPRPLP